MSEEPLREVRDLSTHFFTEEGVVRAVDGISFDVHRSEIVGLVGGSGAGKSVAVQSLMRLVEEPGDLVGGEVRFKDETIFAVEENEDGDLEESDEMLSNREMRERNRGREIAIIIQDQMESLNPVFTVGGQLREFIEINRDLSESEAKAEAVDMLREVGIPEAEKRYDDYPHQFSGGMRQRVLIAMALACEPSLVIADEPTTALDVSIQAQVLNTMGELQDEFGLTYLFISHDLSVIRHISDRVAVMYLGKLVELAEKEELFENPQHPYTRALLDSIPVPDPRESGTRGVLEGDVPSSIDPPSGGRFRTRCPELIAPDDYDLADDEWAAIRRFERAVDRHTFDPASERALRDRFFADVDVRGDARDVVDLVLDDEWDDAATLLEESFADQSVCAREEPSYAVESEHGDGRHYAACHLHRE